MKIRWQPRVLILPCALAFALCANAATQSAGADESKTSRYFDSIHNDPNLLLVFLREMPKGADLHNHLTGSIYAESLIAWAAEAGDCVDPRTMDLAPGPGPCTAPLRAASEAFNDPGLYAKMIDAFSMRNWQYSGQSGHDHFFDTFGKYWQATQGTGGKMLAETATRAASQHEIYQELMYPPGSHAIDTLAKQVGWDDDFAKLEQKLLAAGLPKILADASAELRADESERDKVLQCGTPTADRGCQVEQRFLYQVGRGRPKELVFAEILSGFLLSGGDPSVVPADPQRAGTAVGSRAIGILDPQADHRDVGDRERQHRPERVHVSQEDRLTRDQGEACDPPEDDDPDPRCAVLRVQLAELLGDLAV